MPNLEVISLSINNVETLRQFANCPKLQELYLRKNRITDLSEIAFLQGLRHLHTLWLSDNPCAAMDWYRQFVVRMLPQLRKLDNVVIEDSERAAAVALNNEELQQLHRWARELAEKSSSQSSIYKESGDCTIMPTSESMVNVNHGQPDVSYIHMEGRETSQPQSISLHRQASAIVRPPKRSSHFTRNETLRRSGANVETPSAQTVSGERNTAVSSASALSVICLLLKELSVRDLDRVTIEASRLKQTLQRK